MGLSGFHLENEKAGNTLLCALQHALQSYLDEKPTRSLNGLSKKCTVSEPTLRRILRGHIKTLPTATTILDILTTLTGEKNTSHLAQRFPGPIADYLNSILPQTQDVATEYSSDLNNELKDPVKYIIYKISSNSSGAHKQKILELFGRHGLQVAEALILKNYLTLENEIYFSKVKNFTINQENFIANFKLVADFIKTQNPLAKTSLQSLLANYSESISIEAYKEIIQVQRKALQKIRTIMSDDNSKGPIPLFLLLAIDTLDPQSAHELQPSKASTNSPLNN